MTNTERFAARLDTHLQMLATDELRREFLAREEAKWVRRYEAFQHKVLSNQPITDADGTAWDYVETIAEITGRLALQKEPAHA
jgi:hypothetical protein